MLGSVFEADDAAQETMLRAWQHAGSYQGRASLRTWVYRIATNVCLDILRGRARRAVPMDLGPASSAAAMASVEPNMDQPWVTPIPDPAEAALERETVRLAFVVALQHLPARQRAVLILRDVLAWPAAEVAELLETSVPSVTSMLQRARTTLADRKPAAAGELTEADRGLLARFVDAFQRYDVDALVTLLHEDAVQQMPPMPMWLSGAAEIGRFMVGPGSECRGSRLVPARANGGPAFGQYRRDEHGRYVPWALHLVEIRDGKVAALHSFLDPELFKVFGLPSDEIRRSRSS